MRNIMLEVKNLSVHYGGICAVREVNFQVTEGELVTLIGANGAGKSTTLKAITASQVESAKVTGSIAYLGQDISTLPIAKRAAQGLVLVPEGRGILTRMTVLENLHMGAYLRDDTEGVEADIEKMFGLFPRLKERAQQLAGTLSGGEQQMLAMTRALMLQPKLLLLDEPSMGLSPIMVEKVFEVVQMIASQGVTVLLVEQNAKLALKISQRAYVMESGAVTIEGNSAQLLDDERIRRAYLGE